MRLQIFSKLIVLIFGIALIFGESKFGVINQITASITTFDNEIQLRIQWNDTIQEDWNYNVIVTPENSSECTNSPCGEYGIPSTIKEINLPRERVSYLEYKDCIILPGCSYNIKVESSNGKVSNNKLLNIPYCVDDVCSCRHARDFPKVNMTSEITSNNTITMSWTISLLDKDGFPRGNKTFGKIYEELQLNKIYISISEQTNPSLTWGGKHRLIEQKEYPIKENVHSLAIGLILGSARFKVKQQLYPESRYQIRTHVVDKKRCVGPQSHFMLQMPQHSSELKKMGVSLSLSMRIGIVVLSSLFVSGIVIFITVYLKRRRSKKNAKNSPQMFAHFGINVSPEAMEDNILYVDKDIEDAQFKGLADIFEVPHTALCIGQEIGVGAFGRVFKATAKNILRMRGTTIVAVKQLKTNPTSDEIQEFLSEINMLKGVGLHHNIVSFLGCCTIRPPYMMIMEFVGRGDLLDYLRTVRKRVSVSQLNQTSAAECCQPSDVNNVQKPVKYIELKIATNSEMSFESEEDNPAGERLRPSVTETMYTALSDRQNDLDDENEESFVFDYILDHTELHHFALQIANGMQFLEEQQITHRDLAARNVLIDDRKTLKISDFGLSRHGIYTNTKARKLPLRWLSIEAIRDNIYSNKSDVWAFAVVLWEIGTLGASPYPTISNSELIPYLVSGQRLEKPQICTDQVYKLMLHCWHEDPMLRPTFADVYQQLQPKTVYVDISSISDDYVFPPIQDKS